jgi:hypothetical protein
MAALNTTTFVHESALGVGLCVFEQTIPRGSDRLMSLIDPCEQREPPRPARLS